MAILFFLINLNLTLMIISFIKIFKVVNIYFIFLANEMANAIRGLPVVFCKIERGLAKHK
jgi:hypothetical protein